MMKIQKTKIIGFVSAMLAISPLVAMAAPQTVDDIFTSVMSTFITLVFPILFVIATVIFVVSIIRYLWTADADKAKIRATILWSVIGLAAVVSLWAIVGLFTKYIGVGQIPARFGQPINVQ